jgi:hypothetical protein
MKIFVRVLMANKSEKKKKLELLPLVHTHNNQKETIYRREELKKKKKIVACVCILLVSAKGYRGV